MVLCEDKQREGFKEDHRIVWFKYTHYKFWHYFSGIQVSSEQLNKRLVKKYIFLPVAGKV